MLSLFLHAITSILIDIVGALTGLKDESEQAVYYDIVWIDDTTFLVATKLNGAEATVEASEATLRQHGEIILVALRNRFPTESITSLENHLLALEEEKKACANADTWFARALSFVGFSFFYKRKRKDACNETSSKPSKRLRVN